MPFITGLAAVSSTIRPHARTTPSCVLAVTATAALFAASPIAGYVSWPPCSKPEPYTMHNTSGGYVPPHEEHSHPPPWKVDRPGRRCGPGSRRAWTSAFGPRPRSGSRARESFPRAARRTLQRVPRSGVWKTLGVGLRATTVWSSAPRPSTSRPCFSKPFSSDISMPAFVTDRVSSSLHGTA